MLRWPFGRAREIRPEHVSLYRRAP